MLTFNYIIGLILFLYIIYLNYSRDNNKIPNIIYEIMRNKFARLIIVILICFASIGHKLYGIGGPTIGILFAIAYLITFLYLLYPIRNEQFSGLGNAPVVEGLNNSQSSCGSYPSTNNEYLPNPHRPNESALAYGEPDPISKCGQDFRSCPPGSYTDSGIAYNFNMA